MTLKRFLFCIAFIAGIIGSKAGTMGVPPINISHLLNSSPPPMEPGVLVKPGNFIEATAICPDGTTTRFAHKLLWYAPDYILMGGVNKTKVGAVILGQCKEPIPQKDGTLQVQMKDVVSLYEVIATLPNGEGVILRPYIYVKVNH